LELVEAVKAIPNLILVFSGDGPLGDELAKLHGLENRIYCKPSFLSHDELSCIYATCDFHISCSLFETLGNTVLESHACGTPVIGKFMFNFVHPIFSSIFSTKHSRVL